MQLPYEYLLDVLTKGHLPRDIASDFSISEEDVLKQIDNLNLTSYILYNRVTSLELGETGSHYGIGKITAGNNNVHISHGLDHIPNFVGITVDVGLNSPTEAPQSLRTTSEFVVRYKDGLVIPVDGYFTWEAY
jgi:hypothetical protein